MVRTHDPAEGVAVAEADRVGGLSLVQASLLRQGRTVLADVDLQVRRGQVLALLGPNGSGKSSILRLLAGVWAADRGYCYLDGVDISKLPRRQLARRVSLLPQDTRIEFAYTVEQIVATGRYAHRGRFEPEGAADRVAVEQAMVLCDVAALRHRLVGTLSGGERQRTLIARCLATQAPYLLLDEPTASLDLRHAFDVMALCGTLAQRGHGVVLATHDLAAAARFADAAALVKDGRIMACGSTLQVLTPESIAAVFGVQARVLQSDDGAPAYVFQPLRSSR
jgi:iron complex transport system ATP-binding protein